MTILEAITELEKQRDIALEMGFDPRDTSVMIPHVPFGSDTWEWEELADMKIETTERGTIADLYLRG